MRFNNDYTQSESSNNAYTQSESSQRDLIMLVLSQTALIMFILCQSLRETQSVISLRFFFFFTLSKKARLQGYKLGTLKVDCL
jgi:hypothetical protein